MKTWNRFLKASRPIHIGLSAAMLCIAALCATNAAAQPVTFVSTQTFSSSTFPSGWSGSYECNTCGALYYDASGDGGSNGSVGFDVWDYATEPISPPAINASAYAHGSDSIWADFDFCWEYSGISSEYPDDHFQMYANSDEILNLATSTAYTYSNPSDDNYAVDPPTSSSDWRHYHILIPVADRTSSMVISWVGDAAQGITNPFIDNVTITGFSVPSAELSMTPKSMNFGTAAAGVGDTLYATVKSVGVVPLTITGTSFTGSSAYSIASGPANGTVIPVGSSVQYGIKFLPLNSGTLTGTFTLFTTGADSGTQSISMTGIGAVPDVSYSATSMFRGVNVELTDTSGVQYLYVNSTGQGPLTIKNISFVGLNANNYFITHLPAGNIPSGSVDSIGVRFVPSVEGLPDAHMLITTTAANIPLDTVSLFGVGILPHLTINNGTSFPLPTAINFDSVKLGTESCQQITLTNPGSDTVAIEKNYFESADYDFSISPITGRDTLIPPGGSQQIQVCFTPLQQGHREAEIRIVTNIPHTETTPPQDTSSFIVNITGTGVPTGKLMLTGSTKKDSSTIGTQVCQMDTLWNTGDADITVTGVAISGTNAGDFTATLTTPTPFTLPANSSTTVQLCANPSIMGAETALLTATGTSSETPVTASLILGIFGESIANTAVVSQPFSAESCGLDTEIVLVTNTGNVQDSFQYSVSNAANFTLLTPTNSPVEQAGGVDTIKILFTPPTNGGNATGTLIITGGEIIPPIALTASGGTSVIAGTGNAPMTFIGTTSAAFTVMVANNGTCPWTSGATVTVDPQFTCSTGSTTIAAGSSAPFSFTYTPTVAGGTTYPVTFPLSTSASSVNVAIATATDDVAATSSNGFSLEQNYPNPFSGTSQCEITLPVACVVHLSVVNVEGQVVQTLLNQHYDAGSFEVTLDANGLASGTYYYQMTAGNVTLTKQMVVLK